VDQTSVNFNGGLEDQQSTSELFNLAVHLITNGINSLAPGAFGVNAQLPRTANFSESPTF